MADMMIRQGLREAVISDGAYLAGLMAGYRLGLERNDDAFQSIVVQMRGELNEGRRQIRSMPMTFVQGGGR